MPIAPTPMTPPPVPAETRHQLLVSEDDQGERLDKFLATELEEFTLSRERLQGLIKNGQVLLNHKAETKPSTRLKEADTIEVTIPDAQPIPLQAEPIPLEIIYEDRDLLVVNKPSGMLTHPTGRERTGTLVNALLAHCGDSLSGINGMIRPGIVHRLDRETSGLLMNLNSASGKSIVDSLVQLFAAAEEPDGFERRR